MREGRDVEGVTELKMRPCHDLLLCLHSEECKRPAECCTHTRDLLAVGGALSFFKQELVPSRARLLSAEGRLRDA